MTAGRHQRQGRRHSAVPALPPAHHVGAPRAHSDWGRIIDAIRQPLAVLDEKLRVISANNVFYRTFAVTRDEVVGRYLAGISDGCLDVSAGRSLESCCPALSVRSIHVCDRGRARARGRTPLTVAMGRRRQPRKLLRAVNGRWPVQQPPSSHTQGRTAGARPSGSALRSHGEASDRCWRRGPSGKIPQKFGPLPPRAFSGGQAAAGRTSSRLEWPRSAPFRMAPLSTIPSTCRAAPGAEFWSRRRAGAPRKCAR